MQQTVQTRLQGDAVWTKGALPGKYYPTGFVLMTGVEGGESAELADQLRERGLLAFGEKAGLCSPSVRRE